MQDLKAIRYIKGTKISHDYDGDNIVMHSYRHLWEIGVECIGLPCRQNGFVVIDVDVAGPLSNHKKDGREFWINFCNEYGVPRTYTVTTPSGGFHFYFKLPQSINPDLFSPPGELAPGVDVKWNGWVGAPPTANYVPFYGTLQDVQDLPPSLLAYMSQLNQGKPVKTFDVTDPNAVLDLATPFTQAQLHQLNEGIQWMQVHGSLSRSEWRDGLFALKAGIDDPVMLDDYVCRWSFNKSYVPGDEEVARDIVAKASKHGGVKPPTILAIINKIKTLAGIPSAAAEAGSIFTLQEILDRSQIKHFVNEKGQLKIEPSDANAASIISSIFKDDELYYDSRTGLYMFKGKSHSDRELTNMLIPLIQSCSVGLGIEKFKRNVIASGLDVVMHKRQRDPHKEYLSKLTWDGVPRIESFFSKYVGVEDSEYVRKVGINFWTALAARGMRPGCKFDSMIVLESHEGIHKSSLVQAIGGEYTFTPTKRNSFDDIDILRQMHQAVVVELPELIGLVGQSSEMVKGFLSKPFDHIRGLFERQAIKANRGFVLIGTTNSEKYLKVDMGSRRFWPLRIPRSVKRINIDLIMADRDQLFAEGMARDKDKYPYWDMPEDLLDPVITSRVVEDPLLRPIRDIMPLLGEGFTTALVYQRLEAQGFVPRGYTNSVADRIEMSLRRLGFSLQEEMWFSKSGQTIQQLQSVLTEIMDMSALV